MDLNEELLRWFPGEEHVLRSADSVEVEDRAMNEFQPHPVEYLNSLVSSSLPLAHLKLKVGCPIMLLWNLNASKGLYNGTRLRVVQIRTRVLKCRIMSTDERFCKGIHNCIQFYEDLVRPLLYLLFYLASIMPSSFPSFPHPFIRSCSSSSSSPGRI